MSSFLGLLQNLSLKNAFSDLYLLVRFLTADVGDTLLD